MIKFGNLFVLLVLLVLICEGELILVRYKKESLRQFSIRGVAPGQEEDGVVRRLTQEGWRSQFSNFCITGTPYYYGQRINRSNLETSGLSWFNPNGLDELSTVRFKGSTKIGLVAGFNGEATLEVNGKILTMVNQCPETVMTPLPDFVKERTSQSFMRRTQDQTLVVHVLMNNRIFGFSLFGREDE